MCAVDAFSDEICKIFFSPIFFIIVEVDELAGAVSLGIADFSRIRIKLGIGVFFSGVFSVCMRSGRICAVCISLPELPFPIIFSLTEIDHKVEH